MRLDDWIDGAVARDDIRVSGFRRGSADVEDSPSVVFW
jgi:hypothetical protein